MANPLELDMYDPISKALAQSRESALAMLGRRQAMGRQATATRQSAFGQFGSPVLENLQGRQAQEESEALNQLLGLLAEREVGARQTQQEFDLRRQQASVEQFRYDEGKRMQEEERRRQRRLFGKAGLGKALGSAAGIGLAAAFPGALALEPAILASLIGGGLGESWGGFS